MPQTRISVHRLRDGRAKLIVSAGDGGYGVWPFRSTEEAHAAESAFRLGGVEAVNAWWDTCQEQARRTG